MSAIFNPAPTGPGLYDGTGTPLKPQAQQQQAQQQQGAPATAAAATGMYYQNVAVPYYNTATGTVVKERMSNHILERTGSTGVSGMSTAKKSRMNMMRKNPAMTMMKKNLSLLVT